MESETQPSIIRSQLDQSKVLVEKGYDIIAPAYLAEYSSKPTSTRMSYLGKILARVVPGGDVLELGCGAGLPCTQALIKHGLNVTGVDIAPAQINLARQYVPEAKLIHGDMMAVSFEPESFDAVVGFYSIFHLPKEEQGIMIRKITSWLKVGGWVLFNLAIVEGDMTEDWMGARMFWSGLGVDGNKAMLKEEGKGLKVVEDEVIAEMAEDTKEVFHWILAVKEDIKAMAS